MHKANLSLRGKLLVSAAIAGLTAKVLTPANAQAALCTLDLRLNPASQSDTGGAKVLLPTPGQVVTLDLYAIIQNGDNNRTNDGFQSGEGSFASIFGGRLGNFRSDAGNPATMTNNVIPFKFIIAQSGVGSDLDGDGDLDLGSKITT